MSEPTSTAEVRLSGGYGIVTVPGVAAAYILPSGALQLTGPADEPEEGAEPEEFGPLLYLAAAGTWVDVRTIPEEVEELQEEAAEEESVASWPPPDCQDLASCTRNGECMYAGCPHNEAETASAPTRLGGIEDLTAAQIEEIKQEYLRVKEGRQRAPRGWIRTTGDKYGVSVLTIARLVGSAGDA